MEKYRCKACGNIFHWHHAFSKFGYEDGDGDVQTKFVASILEDAGYAVKYSRWSPHNTIIYSIKKDGVEFMPLGNPSFRIGYDDPTAYLPQKIINILEKHLMPDILFY
ncbi:MAG: hypothetical protein ACRBCS_06725 [Cellvibrionaceae bacterium]